MDQDYQKHRPVIIHRAPFGSMERFTSILIEHFAGDFPVWLSPVQVMIIPVSDQYVELSVAYEQKLKEIDIRVEVDHRNDQIGAKIRDAEKRKIPFMLIIGEREANSGTVSVRRHRQGHQGSLNFTEFLYKVSNEIKNRDNPPNLNK